MKLRPRRNLFGLILAFETVMFITYFFTNPYISVKDRADRFVERLRKSASMDASFSGVQGKTGQCYKNFLLYGMKPYWKDFLVDEYMSSYRYLTDFPREISCPDLNCNVRLKYSEQAEDLAGVDVVVFTKTNEWLSPDMWKWTFGNRTEGQRWVFVSIESPLYASGLRPPDEYADQAYDWYASYKLDSDIYQPYGFYDAYEQPRSQRIDLKNFILDKTHSIAWMSKSCNIFTWKREAFIASLSNLVNVDKFGSCGDVEIPWHDERAVKEVLSKYKFYLSLENSCCVDYITEQFWRSLDIGLVPVVIGASYEQYLKVAPPNSFIHVDQFESIEDLAMYLVTVSNDDEKYLEFHEWRNLGKVVCYNQDEKYISPLMNNTQCAILEKLLTSRTDESKKLDFWGGEWRGSCSFCGYKWIQAFGYKIT